MIITASQLNQKDGTNIEVGTILIMFVSSRVFLLEKCCSYKFYVFQTLQNVNHSITATVKERHRWETVTIIH